MKKQRMYSLVIYQLSGIQAGIQAGHATNEFEVVYCDSSELLQWKKKDKTVVVLDGGSTNQIGFEPYERLEYRGTMDIHLEKLMQQGIECAPFYEPDLNNAMTAISFLVDETVWDKDTYPDVVHGIPSIYISDPKEFRLFKSNLQLEANSSVYGKKTAFLRSFLSNFKLKSN